jgi:LysM repeat protein
MPTKYTIKSGDTLSQIAEDNNTTVTAILKANPTIQSANKIK